ncbi:MAG: hypothetical protein HW421_941 [Ignavibacteria bacterium]|nr:hypothetical protein [Ignavibacteria bacterium]
MAKNTIVVCGATGNQGGAVVDALLRSRDFHVVALTRYPDNVSANALYEKGADVMFGDLNDKASLLAAFKNAHGVFGLTQPWSKDYKKVSTKEEMKQGRNIIEACRESGIRHLVFTSVLSIGMEETGIPHLESKLMLENNIREGTVPFTIFKLATFMDNLGAPYFPIKDGIIKGSTDGDAKIPYISSKDIGEFVTIAFQFQKYYHNIEMNLITDFVSGNELAALLSKINDGESFEYKAEPTFAMKLFAKEFYKMRLLSEKNGRPPYPPEIETAIKNCKDKYLNCMTLEQFLIKNGFNKGRF